MMTKDKANTNAALKLAEQSMNALMHALAEGRVEGDDYQPAELEAFNVLDAIKEALAQPDHEVDWKDQYEKQKRRAEMWRAKLEEVVGPSPMAYPLAQPDYRAVKTYHEGKPVYVSQPEQEPVYLVEDDFGLFRVTNKEDYTYWNGTGRHKTFVANTAPPKRPWVGLTDEEIEDCMEMSIQKTCRAIEAKLKKKNT